MKSTERYDCLLCLATLAVGFLAIATVVRGEEQPEGPAASAAGKIHRVIRIRAIDSDDKPVTGAKIGDYAGWEQEMDEPGIHGLGDEMVNVDPQVTGADGCCDIDAATMTNLPNEPIAIYAIETNRGLVGLANLTDLGDRGELPITMVPWCKLVVNVGSAELAKIGQPLECAKGYVYWGERLRPFFSYSTKDQLRFMLPPGKYRLWAYGSKFVGDKNVDLEIEPGCRSKAIDVELPATRLANLIGHPAPELDQIAAWKNSSPVKLADLKGKVVLVEFWGMWCGPCVQSMPRLMEIYHEFHDRGLEVIAVHTASTKTSEEMDDWLASTAKQSWKGAELPFPLAIDGGADFSDPQKRNGATSAEYGMTWWPTAILIDREGKVIGVFDYRKENARAEMERILKAEGTSLGGAKTSDQDVGAK